MQFPTVANKIALPAFDELTSDIVPCTEDTNVSIVAPVREGGPPREDLSRFLARVLRHEPGVASVSVDSEGWADVSAVVKGLGSVGYSVTLSDLQKLVETSISDRGTPRFSFSGDLRRIRANWGQTIPVRKSDR